MTGKEVMDWIRKHHAENAEIYVAEDRRTYRESEEMYVLSSEDCPCMDMVVIR